jgi:hypothetical protein
MGKIDKLIEKIDKLIVDDATVTGDVEDNTAAVDGKCPEGYKWCEKDQVCKKIKE